MIYAIKVDRKTDIAKVEKMMHAHLEISPLTSNEKKGMVREALDLIDYERRVEGVAILYFEEAGGGGWGFFDVTSSELYYENYKQDYPLKLIEKKHQEKNGWWV